MSEKIEGTMRLEGLIEGPMPPFPDAKDKVEKWAREFTGGVVRISLQFDGGHFSAMPANEFVPVKGISQAGLEPSNAIADGLADLLRYFPPLERSQIFSTIRSVEYRAKQEVQTIYAVGPDGRVATRQQTVKSDTAKMAEPISTREMLKRGVMGLVVAAAILGISSFFVDYRALWRQLTSRVEPATTVVDTGSFAPYLSVQVTGLDLRDGALRLKITRTALYPRDEAAFDALYRDPPAATLPAATLPAATAPATAAATASAPATAPANVTAEPLSLVRRRLAVESLAKGTIWLEFYDKDGADLGGSDVRIDGLEKTAVLETAVAAPMVNRQSVAPARLAVWPQ